MAKGLLAALAAVCLLSASGCGGGDPFVGSWKPVDEPAGTLLVIAKADDGYRVASVSGAASTGWLLLTRSGDTLRGAWQPAPGTDDALPTSWMTVVRDGDRLLLSDNVLRDLALEKVSDATTAPSATP
jgi:hypothetical protein